MKLSIMRVLYVLAAICIVGVYSAPTRQIDYDPKIVLCAKELNINLKAATASNGDSYRLYVCKLEKYGEAPVSSQLHHDDFELFLKRAKESDEIVRDAQEPQARQRLLSMLADCKSKGLNEVDFLKCIKFMEFPYALLYDRFLQRKQLIMRP